MAAQPSAEHVVLAAAVLRRGDEHPWYAPSSHAFFTRLLDRFGRTEASRIWIEAVRIVEAEHPLDPPTHCAPDCAGFCGESYIDEDCAPCQELEAIRYPAAESGPHTCGCGAVIPADQHEAIFDHIDQCPSA